MGRFIVIAILIVGLAAFLAPGLGGRSPAATATTATTAARAPHHRASPWDLRTTPAREAGGNGGEGGETVIERDSTGQFHVDADVGGTEVKFLVDTGADVVALTTEDAERAGIAVDPDSFQPIMQTASGTGYGAAVRIERMTVAGRDLDDVQAVVVRDLPVSLLGQSALARIGRVTLDGDRLVIGG